MSASKYEGSVTVRDTMDLTFLGKLKLLHKLKLVTVSCYIFIFTFCSYKCAMCC